MRQAPGVEETASVLATAPNDGDTSGIDMNLFDGTAKVSKFALWLTATGTPNADLWVQHPTSGTWAKFASFTSISAREVHVVHDIGVFSRVALVSSGTVTMKLQAYIENNFMRGD